MCKTSSYQSQVSGFVVLMVACATGMSAGAAEITAHSVILTLSDQIDVPAPEAGVLDQVAVREGDRLEAGGPVARLQSDDLELLHQQKRLELEIAQAQAADDSELQAAREELQVAKAELARAEASVRRFANAVSATELDRLRLARTLAGAKVDRLKTELAVASSTCDLKQKELDRVALQVERRRLTSPLDGVVVQVYRQAGEWVEPGEKVCRVIRLDTLRAEGFLKIDDLPAAADLVNAPARLNVKLHGDRSASFAGKVVFVSPEIDPVNRQVRVWAEIENRNLQLQPGMKAAMTIVAD